MVDSETLRIDLHLVLERFPTDTRLICRLIVDDESFLSMCEEYSLAAAMLSRLTVSSGEAAGKEIAEYRGLVSELEREIETVLSNAR